LVNQADDYTLYSLLMDAGSFINLPDKLYYYREHTNPNRITTNPARGADIVAGRKVAWNIQLTAKGLRADDAVLNLHDKLTYYPHLINEKNLQNLQEYCQLMLHIMDDMTLTKAQKKVLEMSIERCLSNLLTLKQLSNSTSLMIQLRFSKLLSLQSHLRIFLKKRVSLKHSKI
jgi:hypothetical protein